MSSAIETLNEQIEDYNKLLSVTRNQIAYCRVRIAGIPKRDVKIRIQIDRELIVLHKEERGILKAMAGCKEKKAEYQHDLDMLEKKGQKQVRPEEVKPSLVALDPNEKKFYESNG